MNDASNKPVLNVADIIRKVRKVEAIIKEREAKLEEELKDYKQMAEAGRAVLLKHLHESGQKGATTPDGGCHYRTKVSFQVRDREAFKRHVIGNEAWEMIAWRTNDQICEDYVQAAGAEPPGTYRNAVDILTVTAPAKPRLRKRKPGTLTQEEWDEINREVEAEMDALESNPTENANGDAQ